ncbi:Glycosyl transferase family 2 [Salinimicrobium catena]|uniref:Glycosyl transferase family 2 n=1 Tax=Salinimicrobium catena TaxID=390640 RepID=A0A1H5NB34_9FLAO|nr:glycosyltransferase [Salinimicrobium catena]SDL41673.1 Glycosyl transferase family 2 [Salinimicrobium catena]SEE98783.1 Glycosyl transferase family 2 [Salinimicrobium catena]
MKAQQKENMQPMVSVFMLTYNQEQYVAQAIEGVLMQQTDFTLQLVIGDDFSTDGTREICKLYERKYPSNIKLLLNENNLGIGANYVKTYEACTGKYVAICDGDDYWIDPLKLQKQVEFLEDNPEFKIVFTNNRNIYPSGKADVRDVSKLREISSFEDLLKGNYITSVTAMFQKIPLSKNMKGWMKDLPFGDWPTYLWILKEGGKIKFMDEITAVYRKDYGTSTALRKSKSKMGEVIIAILERIKEDTLFYNRREIVEQEIQKRTLGLMASYNKEKKFQDSFTLLQKAMKKSNSLGPFKSYLYSLKRSLFLL